MPKGISPESLLAYIYAVLHSPTYRTRYAEFLKRDFPRIPLTSKSRLFAALADKGQELMNLHRLESPKLNQFVTEFPIKGDNEVEKVRYTSSNKRVAINDEQYFGNVPQSAYEFIFGGYQPCEKWLTDCRGRKLSYDDVQHWQRIVVAITETTRLTAEIDGLIPSWPLP